MRDKKIKTSNKSVKKILKNIVSGKCKSLKPYVEKRKDKNGNTIYILGVIATMETQIIDVGNINETDVNKGEDNAEGKDIVKGKGNKKNKRKRKGKKKKKEDMNKEREDKIIKMISNLADQMNKNFEYQRGWNEQHEKFEKRQEEFNARQEEFNARIEANVNRIETEVNGIKDNVKNIEDKLETVIRVNNLKIK